MSKQSKAKDEQAYNPKPTFPICSTCKHFQMDRVPVEWNPSYLKEINLRCGLGKFAVKKQGTCNAHEPA